MGVSHEFEFVVGGLFTIFTSLFRHMALAEAHGSVLVMAGGTGFSGCPAAALVPLSLPLLGIDRRTATNTDKGCI